MRLGKIGARKGARPVRPPPGQAFEPGMASAWFTRLEGLWRERKLILVTSDRDLPNIKNVPQLGRAVKFFQEAHSSRARQRLFAYSRAQVRCGIQPDTGVADRPLWTKIE